MTLLAIDWLSAANIQTAIRIAFVILFASALTWATRIAIGRLRARLEDGLLRKKQRAETLSGVLMSTATVLIWTVAFIYVLTLAGFSPAPLLASVSVAGIAIGFG